MHIGIVAGEASGDLLGAELLKALKKIYPDLKATGVGGPAMIQEGFHSLFDINRLSVMGFIEPLPRLPDLLKIRRELFHSFLKNPIDVFIGIDSPAFNLGLELKLRKKKFRTIHYVSPSVWAWRQNRIHKIKKAVDGMLTLFPFEVDFYKKHHVPVYFVGHPLADTIPLFSDKYLSRKKLEIPSDATYIALLPGSRQNEIKYVAPVLIQAAKEILKKRPEVHFITSAINSERNQEFQKICREYAPDLPIHFFQGRSHEVMAASDVVMVTAGTATLEVMLFKRPMVIVYRMAKLTYYLARFLVKTPFIGLPNIIANRLLVPELIQDEAQPEKIANAILTFLDHPEKIEHLQKLFCETHQQLKSNASEKAALVIKELIRSSR